MIDRIKRAVAVSALFALAGPGAAWAQRPWPWQWDFQAAGSPTMERIAALTLAVNIIIVAIVVLVVALLGYVMWRFRAERNPVPARWTHNTKLELLWTTIPVVILVAIAFPSFQLLYYMDRVKEADMTIKVTGHQWYWSYEYPEHEIGFDSLMVQEEDLAPDQLRLLSTDNPVVLPAGVPIRIQMTADDVIHAWAVPALGLKTDTVPGRLNETWVRIDKPGTYYGQCSELCGVNHAFMPIEIRAVPPDEWQAWLERARQEFALARGGTAVARAD